MSQRKTFTKNRYMYKNTPLSDTGQLPAQKNETEIRNIKTVAIGASTPRQLFGAMVDYVPFPLINCCQGGKDVNDWKTDRVWAQAMKQVDDPSSINVVMMSHDDLRQSETPENLGDKILEVIAICEQKFPNLKKVVLFNRLYTGWATLDKHKEPAGYNNGLSCIYAVENYAGSCHIAAYDTWTSATTPRADGFQIARKFFNKDDGTFDGVHLGSSGAQKIAKQMASMLKHWVVK